MNLSTTLVMSALLLCLVTAAFGAEGDWPMWRRDSSLTAYQPLPGAMKRAPRILAKHFLGAGTGAQTFADLMGTGKKQDSLVLARARLMAYDADGKLRWQSAPQGYVLESIQWVEDLDGDGKNEVVAVAGAMGGTRLALLILDGQTGKLRGAIPFNTGDFSWRAHCGAYLSGKPGKQIFLVTSMRQAETGKTPTTGQFSLWRFDGKQAVQQWAWTPKEYNVLYPATLIGDLNGDGQFHAIINSWCHVWNIALATGEQVSHTDWDPKGANRRQYGWNQLIDVNGDGKLDYVNVALTKHVDVLLNVDGKLQLAWTQAWPDPVTTESNAMAMPSDPAVDLDGDGKMELVSAVFEGAKDSRWKLTVWDAVTGATKAEMRDLVPLMSVPLWGEKGGRALLCARSTRLSYDPPESYEAWRLREGKWEKLRTLPDGSFLDEGVSSDDRLATYFTGVNPRRARCEDVDEDGRPEFFTQRSGTGNAPQAWGVNAAGELVAKPGQPAPKLISAPPPALPRLQGVTVPYLLAADVDADGKNEILLYDNVTVTVLRLEKKTLRVVETFPSSEVPVVCDLLGDGKPCVLTAGRGENKNLWVQARNAERKILWRVEFPNSAACGQYSERPHYFTVGRFTGRKGVDVFTYSTKPDARTYVLDGRTGKPVWERAEMPEIERHFQAFGGRAGVWDYNHDSADDIVFTNPDYYCVANGKTGELLVGPVSVAKLVTWWAAYASPAVLPRKGAEPIVYLTSAYSSRATISLDGTRCLWHEYLPTERWPLGARVGSFAEGVLPPSKARGWRVAQVEADGAFVCFAADTGETLWKLPLPTAPSSMISGDVDGDGEPEFVFGGQDGNLLVVRDAGSHGEILWRKTFSAPVGASLLADVDGDGKSELIVSVGDGYITVLGGSR